MFWAIFALNGMVALDIDVAATILNHTKQLNAVRAHIERYVASSHECRARFSVSAKYEY